MSTSFLLSGRRARTISIALCVLGLVLAMSATSIAQEEPSRLRYETPQGWTPSIDLRSLLLPGGGAGVTFLPSTAFAGEAEQWLAESWNGILRELKLLTSPQSGQQGEFLTRMGIFQQADGTMVWLCLYTLLEDGRGEGVVFFAAGETPFLAHLATVNDMVSRASVAPLADRPNSVIGGGDASGVGGAAPSAHRLIGKWYNEIGYGNYIRYQFTDVGAYGYSSPLGSISGTFAIANDKLTLQASDGTITRYTFRFECIGTGSFSEYLTLSDDATHLETPYVRDPTDPGQRCK
jgi:hypothetical protein